MYIYDTEVIHILARTYIAPAKLSLRVRAAPLQFEQTWCTRLEAVQQMVVFYLGTDPAGAYVARSPDMILVG